MVELLMKQGAHPNFEVSDGSSALIKAIDARNKDVVT
jgi:hypothetical protein